MRVCRDWSQVRRLEHREAWALRVAINLASSHYRRRRAERRAKERLEARPTGPHDSDWGAGVAMRKALATLPARQRAVLIMRFYADLPFAEIAEAMNVGESTAKSLARRGLERLRKDPAVPGIEEVTLA